jgi:transcriptional regulator with XRE-family HTH domain
MMPRSAASSTAASARTSEHGADGRPILHANTLLDLWLGEQLRELRKSQGLSLVQLAAACGISIGRLSQIERGLSAITVSTLNVLARELGVAAETLLRNAEPHEGDLEGHVARAGTHRFIRMDDKGIVKESVTPAAGLAMDLFRMTIEPGGSTGDTLFATDKGEQMGVVLEGLLELRIGEHVTVLGPGDSFCYASRTPRRWRNPGDSVTRVVWVICNLDPEPQAAAS